MSDALKQYLELYGQAGATLREHSCAPLNALRDAAAATLRDARLPRPESDNYENCDLEAMLAPDYG
ncbi:MAG: Fe-S cluster assembly protein SufD, partial [Bacteroidales bacterium]|nr:Fe-S cluster assembly protein SufD [Bacteroidales bacterium]